MPPDSVPPALWARLEATGQTHLLSLFDQLDAGGRQRLINQLESIDFQQVARLQSLARQEPPRPAGLSAAELASARTPRSPRLRESDQSSATPAEAAAAGAAMLAAGEVGAVIVAGGQATRLRCEGPKGVFPIGPVSQASLFELLLGRLKAVATRSGHRLPLAIMTSSATDAQTREFLGQHAYFGLDPAELLFFRQGDLPAITLDGGNLMLDAADHVAMAPDGHGGLLQALSAAGGLEWFARFGCRDIVTFQVDNPLAMPLDEEFLGHHRLGESEFTTQVVEKTDPAERVGVVAEIDGTTRLIEYSDLPEELAEAREADGRLRLRAGSIAIHAFTREFLERAADSDGLPLHLARKAVPHLDEAGRLVTPRQPNAVKFERFIFDLMPLARRVLPVEVDAAEGFAPLKNPSGSASDSPEHVRAAMVHLARRRCLEAGIDVAEGVSVELAPDTLTAEILRRRVAGGRIDADRVV
jgi:UDP-N-acetylglucosamine/UDP-N-acetylgalactosamine diphosphorylase